MMLRNLCKMVVCAAALVASGASAASVCSGTVRGESLTLKNHAYKYLVGHRMRPHSLFAQCQDGAIVCYEDTGVTDSTSKEIDCDADVTRRRVLRQV